MPVSVCSQILFGSVNFDEYLISKPRNFVTLNEGHSNGCAFFQIDDSPAGLKFPLVLKVYYWHDRRLNEKVNLPNDVQIISGNRCHALLSFVILLITPMPADSLRETEARFSRYALR